MTKVLQFLCGDCGNRDEAEALLDALPGVSRMRRATTRRTYLDSFDGRLKGHGLILEADGSGPMTAALRHCRQESIGPTLKLAKLPQRAEQLPRGKVRNDTCSLLKERALIAWLTCVVDTTCYRITDDAEKTIAHFTLEQLRQRTPPSDSHRNPLVLRFRPMRGYAPETSVLIKDVAREIKLHALERDVAYLYLQHSGEAPAEYTAKPCVAIAGGRDAKSGLADVLAAYRLVMTANEQGIMDDIDIEFLHDFRVAMRRSRSLANAFRALFPERDYDRFKSEFAWMSAASSQLRDLDVFLALIREEKMNAVAAQAQAGAQLQPLVERERARELRKMLRVLRSKRYAAFQRDWAQMLERLKNDEDARHECPSVADLARAAIWRRHVKVRERMQRLRAHTTMEALHGLRKDCKKLRYLLEGFRSLFPRKKLARAVVELRALQDLLGEICDYNVQGNLLRKWRDATKDPLDRHAILAAPRTRLDPIAPGTRRQLSATLHRFDRRATDYDSLDLVPADFSYRNLDLELGDRKKSSLRLRKLLKTVRQEYDLVFLDCAPSLSKVSENVFNMADWLLVPLIPTHLSLRAFEQLVKFRKQNGIHGGVLLPFFSMVDRRKRLHCELVRQFASDHTELLRSFVPYASQIERMGEHRAPVNAFADRSPGGRACHALWVALCERISIAPRDPNDGNLP